VGPISALIIAENGSFFYFVVKIDFVRGGDIFSGLSRRRYPENLLSYPRLAITRPRKTGKSQNLLLDFACCSKVEEWLKIDVIIPSSR